MFGLVGVSMIALRLRWRYSLLIVALIYAAIMLVAFRYGAHCLRQDAKTAAGEPQPTPADLAQDDPAPDAPGATSPDAQPAAGPASAG